MLPQLKPSNITIQPITDFTHLIKNTEYKEKIKKKIITAISKKQNTLKANEKELKRKKNIYAKNNRIKRKKLLSPSPSPINQPFENCCQHHIDHKNTIFIPKEMHYRIHHHLNHENSMKTINILAWTFMETTAL